MGRRRRKPSRPEPAVVHERHGMDAERLTPDPGLPFEGGLDGFGEEGGSLDALLYGAPPRELVFFELVEGESPPVLPPAVTDVGGSAAEAEAAPGEVAASAQAPGAEAEVEPAVSEPPEGAARVSRSTAPFEEPPNPESALDRLESERLQHPDDVGVLLALAATLGLLGRFDDAARELRRAQKLAPDDVAVRAGVGLLYFRRGLYAQAEAELRWVCEHDPDHGPAHFYRGEALNRLGRVDQALEAVERAAQLQPTNYRVFYTLGILFDRKNLRDQAKQMYRKARELQHR